MSGGMHRRSRGQAQIVGIAGRGASALAAAAAFAATIWAASQAQAQAEDGRVYGVIEYLANQVQIVTDEVRVRGDASCMNETYCTLSEDSRQFVFSAAQLPDPDRIALIRSGSNGHAVRKAIVTVKGAAATHVEFSD